MTEIEVQVMIDERMHDTGRASLDEAEDVPCGSECGLGTMRGETGF